MPLQTFPTDIGALYDVTFYLSRNPLGTDLVRTVLVSAGNVTEKAFDVALDAARTPLDMLYQQQTLTFRAVDTTTTLSFKEEDTLPPPPLGVRRLQQATIGNDTTGAVIDTVSVVPSSLSENRRWLFLFLRFRLALS